MKHAQVAQVRMKNTVADLLEVDASNDDGEFVVTMMHSRDKISGEDEQINADTQVQDLLLTGNSSKFSKWMAA